MIFHAAAAAVAAAVAVVVAAAVVAAAAAAAVVAAAAACAEFLRPLGVFCCFLSSSPSTRDDGAYFWRLAAHRGA